LRQDHDLNLVENIFWIVSKERCELNNVVCNHYSGETNEDNPRTLMSTKLNLLQFTFRYHVNYKAKNSTNITSYLAKLGSIGGLCDFMLGLVLG